MTYMTRLDLDRHMKKHNKWEQKEEKVGGFLITSTPPTLNLLLLLILHLLFLLLLLHLHLLLPLLLHLLFLLILLLPLLHLLLLPLLCESV
jgi:hypothetical protein